MSGEDSNPQPLVFKCYGESRHLQLGSTNHYNSRLPKISDRSNKFGKRYSDKFYALDV